MGVICATPTAGSSGVLPGALLTTRDRLNLDRRAQLNFLITAGGTGILIGNQASISGAEGGCQAEVGSASAMTAAALVEAAGGTPSQSAHALAIALKNLLGLSCDPVASLVEVPCIKRNAVGVVNAIAAAEMALAGIESRIPVDEVIQAMGSIGRMMPVALRETALGGLAPVSYTHLKQILVGKGGSKIKSIGIASRSAIESLLEAHVDLSLFVKVKRDWQNRAHYLRESGISER